MVAGINPPLVKLEAQKRRALAMAVELDRRGCWWQAVHFRAQARCCQAAHENEAKRIRRVRQ